MQKMEKKKDGQPPGRSMCNNDRAGTVRSAAARSTGNGVGDHNAGERADCAERTGACDPSADSAETWPADTEWAERNEGTADAGGDE